MRGGPQTFSQNSVCFTGYKYRRLSSPVLSSKWQASLKSQKAQRFAVRSYTRVRAECSLAQFAADIPQNGVFTCLCSLPSCAALTRASPDIRPVFFADMDGRKRIRLLRGFHRANESGSSRTRPFRRSSRSADLRSSSWVISRPPRTIKSAREGKARRPE